MAAKLTSPMEQLSYEIRFVTPAFLGDAEQNGAWRTPPFKALLRQWWRVAAAKRYNYNVSDLRKEEGQVFGNAWIEDAFCKSAVRIRLERWEEGKLKKAVWPGKDETKLIHPEVTNKEGKKMPVGVELYLGYGPLNYDKLQKRTVLKKNAAIQSDETATLRLAWPGLAMNRPCTTLCSSCTGLAPWAGDPVTGGVLFHCQGTILPASTRSISLTRSFSSFPDP